MKRFIIMLAVAMCAIGVYEGRAQSIASMQQRMSSGRNAVRVTEAEDASAAIRAVEHRTKRTKVNGYTIVILFDNSQQARENAVEAKETFLANFKGVNIDVSYENPWFTVSVGRYLTMEEAIIELGRIRSVFPKAFPRNIELDITDFVIGEGSDSLSVQVITPEQPAADGKAAEAAGTKAETAQ